MQSAVPKFAANGNRRETTTLRDDIPLTFFFMRIKLGQLYGTLQIIMIDEREQIPLQSKRTGACKVQSWIALRLGVHTVGTGVHIIHHTTGTLL